ncbi:MAG: sulfotransferase [Planctomycetes bacterium]|nr:sulfotransferase [Planctomycetota bacterium]
MSQSPALPPIPAAKKPEWAPRMWEGCDFFAWLGLLFRNRCAVEFRYWYIAVIVTFVSFNHTLLRLLQDAIFGRVLRKTRITQPPVFILGHWRTGTTLLHEFMIRDERFGFPTTYECMDPNHFLLTEGLFTGWLSFLMPSSRPMDNMKAGFDRPQEDEFALCMMGAGSPYSMIAFPNQPPQEQEYLDLEGVSEKGLRRWKRAFKRFLRCVTYKTGKRLVLKSPPHTARIRTLSKMFPEAIFIHIVRDPHVVFPSTVNLWRTLFKTHGLQTPNYIGLEEFVLTTFSRMYDRLEEGKKLLGAERFYEIRYEDMIKDPTGEMKKIFDHFQLGGFDAYLPRLQEYLASIKGYETNKYQLSDDQRRVLGERWGEVIRRYGYESQPV